MTFTPSQARQYKVTVPTKGAAEDVARTLADRGHQLVAIRAVGHYRKDPNSFWYNKAVALPGFEGHWDVFSLVNGPEPDSDSPWWTAMEEKALRELARRSGGHTQCQSIHANTHKDLQRFNRDGLVYELNQETASMRRLESLGACPARASEREPNLSGVDEDLPSGPGQPIPLEGVEDIDWSALEHAYGEATDVPDILHTLSANDERWEEADSQLLSSVLHQETVYSSTAPAMKFVAKLAAAPQLSGGRRLSLLYTLFIAGSQQAIAEAGAYELGDIGPEVRDAVVSQVGELLRLWSTVSRAERRLLLLLSVLVPEGVPVERSDLVDPASRLAEAMSQSHGSAEGLLSEMAKSNEDLIELTEGDVSLRPRLIAALQKLLFSE